jgi:histidine kinase
MSIRTKLWVSYSLMVLVPIVLTAIFAHLLHHVFAGQMQAVKSHFNLDGYSLGDFLHGEVMAIAELQTIMRENPDQLLVGETLDGYGDRLARRKIGIVLFRSGDLRYASKGWSGQPAGRLPLHRLADSESYSFREESLHLDGKWYAGFQYTFRFGDQTAGNLFLLLDGDPLDRLASRLLPSFALAFLAAIILANVLLTWWMSRRILQPIGELTRAAERIKDGNLEQPVNVGGHDELGRLGRVFEEMRRRLEESVRERLKTEENRRQLIANISHDLKTPVTAIIGYAEGILDGLAAGPERLEKYARTIHAHAASLNRLVDELFLYSKLDLNRVPFRFSDLDLREYAGQVAEEFRLQTEHAGITLEVESPETPVWVRADPEQLRRVFVNLLDNSVRHLDKEEKRITIRILSEEEDGAYVRVEIRDNGAGIDRQDLPRIFDAFYRADSSRHEGGSGLGLAIAAQIVKAHGGEIRADSELGKGTTVAFTLQKADGQGRD